MDGSLDPSFGNDGLVTSSFPGFAHAFASSMAVQADGRIVVAGSTDNSSTDPRFALARYASDGSLDDSFENGGLVATSFPGLASSSARSVAVQADGRIVVAGEASTSTNRFALARYEGGGLPATWFTVSAPATANASQSFSVTVTALDDNGNVVPDYRGTVSLTSTDPAAVLPGSHTFVAGDAGVFTFSGVQLFTAGPESLVAAAGSHNGQTDLVVLPGEAVQILLSASDGVLAGVTAGTSFVVTVTAYDAWGNVATGYRGAVSFVSTDLAGVLPPAYAFSSDDAGSHDFTITLNTPGLVRLTAIDTYALTLSYLDLTVN